jgi:hypothetical protein
MTKRVAMIYAAAIVVAVVLRVAFARPDSVVYQTYRDVIPLIIALPAAFLAQAFQRRSSYVQGLRTVWGNMVGAVAAALAYTELPSPPKEQFADVLHRLSASIEEVRGFYGMWRRVRERFVTELEVEVPTHHHAAYAPTVGSPTRS